MVSKFTYYIASLLFASCVLAQEYERPDQFFEKGYVNKDGGHQDITEPETPQLPALKRTPSAMKKEQPKSELEEETADIENTAEIDKPGVKVKFLSAILSPDDPEHFRKFFSQMLALRDKHKIPMKNIMLVGDPARIYDSSARELLAGTGNIGVLRYMIDIPKEYREVKTSPTFIVETKDGEYLLEGFSDLRRSFNRHGEFIEPDQQLITTEEVSKSSPVQEISKSILPIKAQLEASKIEHTAQ